MVHTVTSNAIIEHLLMKQIIQFLFLRQTCKFSAGMNHEADYLMAALSRLTSPLLPWAGWRECWARFAQGHLSRKALPPGRGWTPTPVSDLVGFLSVGGTIFVQSCSKVKETAVISYRLGVSLLLLCAVEELSSHMLEPANLIAESLKVELLQKNLYYLIKWSGQGPSKN